MTFDEVDEAFHTAGEENAEWGPVAGTTNKASIEAFLSHWPQGQHADAARARIRELRRASTWGIWAGIGLIMAQVLFILAIVLAFVMLFDAPNTVTALAVGWTTVCVLFALAVTLIIIFVRRFQRG